MVKGTCPQLQGQILGGSIYRGKDMYKFRLWLYDLQSGQVAYQDDYCQSCDITAALAAQSQRLMANPQFGNAAGPVPLYCGQPSGAASSSPSPNSQGPIHLVVYGDGKNKAALYGALRAHIGLRGRQVMPVAAESQSYPIDVLQKIVAGNKDAQVVGAELGRDGKVGVFVFDGRSEQTADKVLDCVECAQNKDILVARVQQEISALLDRCYGEQCSGGARSSAMPAEACEPFAEQSCTGLDELLSKVPQSVETATSVPASRLAPSTARAIKGLVWGGVALSAATSVGLFIANSTGAGTHVENNGIPITNTLGAFAWGAAGLTVGLLGLAIPTTVIVNRATPGPAAKPAQEEARSRSQSPIRCPE